MRWSQMFIPTLRQNPVGVDSASHRLLLRGGYIRQLMAGHYALLPLAVRVRSKVMTVIREEMNRIGGQEFLTPALHPAEVWQRSGRWESIGQEMFRFKDRRNADIALGMTHEEIFAWLAEELGSYRELPQLWYQLQTKFRDEPRPKAGLLRTREFTMKDAYSLDIDQAGLDRSFEANREAYSRIFARMGISAIQVEASSGIMGGSDSVEFMSACQAGEDDIVISAECGYAANVETATSPVPEPPERSPSPQPERFETPGVRTIEALAAPPYDAAAPRQIKTLVYVLDGTLTLVLLRGDHSLVEQKLADVTGTVDLRPAHPDEIREGLGALPGSLGAVGVTGLPVIADTALRGERDMVTGANADGFHLRHVDADRDITVNRWADLRRVGDGDPCPQCGNPLKLERAIEIGHIFKLGRRYTEAFGVTVPDAEGGERTVIMGSYGIGVERAMAAVVEAFHDEKGIAWPVSVAPFEVAVVPLVTGDDAATQTAEQIYKELLGAGIDVVLDDRNARAGAKLTDIELTGIPFRIAIGPRGLAEGVVELTSRASGETLKVPVDGASAHAATAVAAAKAELQPSTA
jgi:prolyl-tRNA synthetase